MLVCLEGRVELLLRQTPTLEEKGLQLEIINGIFINRLSHPLPCPQRRGGGALGVTRRRC